jgi:hypothetical protein
MIQESFAPRINGYTATAIAYTRRTRRNYEVTHAANNERGYYRTLCGKLLDAEAFDRFADEPHTITCASCAKVLRA